MMTRLRLLTGLKPAWMTAAGIAAVFLAALALTWPFIDPAPPQHVTIATGPGGGFYDRLGRQYAGLLEESGIEVRLRSSLGSRDNLAALASGKADFAFLQGGTGHATAVDGVFSAAGVALEPVWIFSTTDGPLTRLDQLRGKSLAAGPDGSGTRLMADILLKSAGLEQQVSLSPLSGEAAEKALLSGQVDAVLYVTAASTPPVARLLRRSDVALAKLERADAFQRNLPWLSVIDIPEGSIDLKENVPTKPVRLLGAVTGLAMRGGVHPALTALMLDSARRIHGSEIVYGELGRFPSATHTDFPLSDEARRYFEHGPSFLRRFLPFWAANMVDRLWVLLIPLATIMVPLLRAAPPVYRWQIRRRIYRWYRTLKDIEYTWWADHSPATRDRLLKEMDSLQAEVGQIEVPLSYADEVYRLRTHIQFVEQLVRDGRRPAAIAADGSDRAAKAPPGQPGPEASGMSVTPASETAE